MNFLGSILMLEKNGKLLLLYVIYFQISFLTDLDDLFIISVLLGIFVYLTFVVIGVKNIVSLFSKHFLKQSLKVLAVSNPKQLFFILKIVQLQYLTLACDLILVS